MNGFLLARAITRKHAKTFYFASRLLKKGRKNAAYAVYAICRLSDDIVDNGQDIGDARNLTGLREKIDSAYSNAPLADPLLSAFRQTVNKYHLPKKYFDALIEGMEMDLRKSRYRNFEELYDYSYKVAGVIGLIMLEIFGYRDQRAAAHAVNLGIAMQLTNILRDIKEDFRRGRIYLPEEEMQRFGVSESDISEGRIDANFKELMKFQIGRCREYYAQARPGIRMIGDLNSRLVALAMAEMYAGILKAIEKNYYDCFSRRAGVSAPEKIGALLKIILKGEYR
ncbi:MAG: phytoene/squalene synthase family protein [Candidatus Omnitrophota bacterium]|jgi:phytoene synthase